MDFIISLAHFCEVHGPTSILCTQLNPVSCASCFPCPTPPSEDISRNSSFTSSFWEPPASPGFSTATAPLLYSPFESPPTSPRSTNSSYNPYFGEHLHGHGNRGSFSRSSIGSDPDGDSCDNCSFLVPKDMSERLPDGAPGSPTKDGRGRHGSPVLRTTQAIIARGLFSDSDSDREDEYAREEEHLTKGTAIPTSHKGKDDEEEIHDPLTYPSSSPSSVYTAASSATSSSQRYLPHTHNLTYVTTRQPTSPSAYSRLRRSCIRTLSFEKLPRGSPSGPLYFGDPIAGYTIAYIFRLPDPRARGRRRTYALIALGGRDSWRVSTRMVGVTRAFEGIASWILSMAEKALGREREGSTVSSGFITPPMSSSLPNSSSADAKKEGQEVEESSPDPQKKEKSKSATTSPVQISASKATATTTTTLSSFHSASTSASSTRSQLSDTSSFLSAKRVDPDGYPRVSREVMRAKGLAEIVGREDFFVELHARFCMVLRSLVGEGVQ